MTLSLFLLSSAIFWAVMSARYDDDPNQRYYVIGSFIIALLVFAAGY